jgi:osmotically-inducible protein OsmY
MDAGGWFMNPLTVDARSYVTTAVLAFVVLASITLAGCAPSVGANTDDASITARVRTVLMNDAQIDALKIDVATSSGVVTISGVVRSPGEADRALTLARQVEGVKEVKSTIQVTPSGG